MLHRSVEVDSFPEKHGMERHFRTMADASRIATELDRTRQYRQVTFYRVEH